ncbi:hypothetical protein, partial [Paracoccus sp. 22332]|uniref:hypothetical protein n=1 Tax=Paracoccus sp. 22332 TaxID=3453913 RepID=UPI003F825754
MSVLPFRSSTKLMAKTGDELHEEPMRPKGQIKAPLQRECPELCVSDRLHAVSDTQASKRSPNIMANWLRAA